MTLRVERLSNAVLVEFPSGLYVRVHGAARARVVHGALRAAHFTFEPAHDEWMCLAPYTDPAVELCAMESISQSTNEIVSTDGNGNAADADDGDEEVQRRFVASAASDSTIVRFRSLFDNDASDDYRAMLAANECVRALLQWPEDVAEPRARISGAAAQLAQLDPPLMLCKTSNASREAAEAPTWRSFFEWLSSCESDKPPSILVVGSSGVGKVCWRALASHPAMC